MKKKQLAILTVSILTIAIIAVCIAMMINQPDTEQQTEPTDPTAITTSPAVEPATGTVYVSNQCLYMNPLSSFFAFGGNSGYRYHILEDSFIIERRDEGLSMAKGYEVIEGGSIVFENIDWNWIPVSEAGKELDTLFENSKFYQFGPLKQEVLYQPISENYFLIQEDGKLMLYEVRPINKMGRQIWSIYSLVPESDMGSAQWEFVPASSSSLPLFCFEFDMDCTDINAVCTQSSTSTYDELKGIYITPQLKDGHTIYWSPINEYGEIVSVADISFTTHNGDLTTAAGTIYITGEPSKELGGCFYTATIVGTGLHINQNPDGEGAVITHN